MTRRSTPSHALPWFGGLGTSLQLGLGLSLACGAPAAANDTNAVIGAGGLQFTKTTELKMEREDLFLSTEAVRVKYSFRNLTDHDITTTVAFPMPDLDMSELSEEPHQFHLSGQEGDIVDFHVRVDGQDVKPSLEVHAINPDGKDVSDLLHRSKIPITEVRDSNDVYNAIKALKPDEAKALIDAHAIYDDGEHPSWIAKSAYHWQQTFPAHAAITVEHWYKPVVGGSLVDVVKPSDEFLGPWCPDASFLTGARKLKRAEGGYVPGDWIEYVLKTGANWAGPIGHFRLELDKGKAALLSTCPIPGLTLKKQGNSFIAEADAFTPTTDLKILFLNNAE